MPEISRDTSGGRGTHTLQGEALEHDLRQSVGNIVQYIQNTSGGGGGGAGGTYTPIISIELQCQSNDADENLRNSHFFDITYFTNALLVINQTNSGDGTYYAEFWNGTDWEDLCVASLSITTTGDEGHAEISAWGTIKETAKISGGTFIRVRQTGGGSSTDVGLAAILFKGPAVGGEQGPPGEGSAVSIEDDGVLVVSEATTINVGVNITVKSVAGSEVELESWEPIGNGDWEDPDILYQDGNPLMHPPTD